MDIFVSITRFCNYLFIEMATPMETRWQLVPYFTITFNNHICFFISSWRLDCVKWKSLGLKLLLQLHWLVAVHRSKEVTPVFRYHDVIMTNGIHGENEAACERQRIHARLIPPFKTAQGKPKLQIEVASLGRGKEGSLPMKFQRTGCLGRRYAGR